MILVTGANGFVGRYLCPYLAGEGRAVVSAVRTHDVRGSGRNTIAVGDIDSQTDWNPVLKGVKTVIHLAARVHVFGKGAQALDEYRRVNVGGSVNLARQAAKAGVRRFVYISTIKVHGEESLNTPFKPDDEPAPADWYSVSKLEAEKNLTELCDAACMELVIIRPPLIYGRGAKGNFAKLVSLVRKGYYLPFGKVSNRRSLMGIENFCSLVAVCSRHPAAPGRILLASDGQDVSTPDLVRLIAQCSNRPVRLVPVPASLLLAAANLLGMGAQMRKLTGNLQVDSSETRNLLGWTPPLTLEQGIAKSV